MFQVHSKELKVRLMSYYLLNNVDLTPIDQANNTLILPCTFARGAFLITI
jgi:hypothetical protein